MMRKQLYQCLREFVNERLTAAAEEISRVFEQTIVEYEEEIDRQRRLLDIVWKPEIRLHRTELPQQHPSEEVPHEQQLCNQERNPVWTKRSQSLHRLKRNRRQCAAVRRESSLY
ncbi:zinc finger protein 250-like protein [Lates japonicus]|uniref:Zinc finger protein 250-like protein n=1 Tax=Lates japonicus TaxID=270547 RepID=A0AAD3R037_LATJO|nr:zinc finger protein 250-like protein [Lates japonicus]